MEEVPAHRERARDLDSKSLLGKNVTVIVDRTQHEHVVLGTGKRDDSSRGLNRRCPYGLNVSDAVRIGAQWRHLVQHGSCACRHSICTRGSAVQQFSSRLPGGGSNRSADW